MSWIFLMMLAMIGGSIVVELVLPERIKQTFGNVICWLMMAVTMSSLGLATLGLIYVAWDRFLSPLLLGA